MNDNIGKYFICDGKLYDVEEYNSRANYSHANIVGELSTGDLYEVLRAIDNKLLFFNDHMVRLKNSLKTSGVNYQTDQESLKEGLLKLITACGYETCNLKIVITKKTEEYVLYAYLSKFNYPQDMDYVNGVDVDFINIERKNPNAKVIYVDYKKHVSEVIKNKNLFEVLLVNNKGTITEGSRTNVFFIINNIVYTAPAEIVLEGITRKHAIKACEEAGIEVREEEVPIEKVLMADGVFLSGTSIKCLPVYKIGDRVYDTGSSEVFKRVLSSFDKIMVDGLER